MANTAHRPSQSTQEWVKNRKGERVRNTAYKGRRKTTDSRPARSVLPEADIFGVIAFDDEIRFYKSGIAHSYGAPEVSTRHGGLEESWWLNGKAATQDEVVADASYSELVEAAETTGSLVDRFPGREPIDHAYRASLISLLSKVGGKPAAQTERDSGEIIDKLLSKSISKKDLVHDIVAG